MNGSFQPFLEEAIEERDRLRSELRGVRLMMRGWLDEHCHVRVVLPLGEMVDAKGVEAVQVIQEDLIHRLANHLQEKVGDPMAALREVVMHVHYLENHATNRGLPFKPMKWTPFLQSVLRS